MVSPDEEGYLSFRYNNDSRLISTYSTLRLKTPASIQYSIFTIRQDQDGSHQVVILFPRLILYVRFPE
jgi:hypothetical protein